MPCILTVTSGYRGERRKECTSHCATLQCTTFLLSFTPLPWRINWQVMNHLITYIDQVLQAVNFLCRTHLNNHTWWPQLRIEFGVKNGKHWLRLRLSIFFLFEMLPHSGNNKNFNPQNTSRVTCNESYMSQTKRLPASDYCTLSCV